MNIRHCLFIIPYSLITMHSPVKIWRNQKHIANLLGKEGVIVAWTFIRVPPSGFSSVAPYPVVLVELSTHEKVTAQLVDYEEKDLEKGTKVRVVVRRAREATMDGIIPYGIKVTPL